MPAEAQGVGGTPLSLTLSQCCLILRGARNQRSKLRTEAYGATPGTSGALSVDCGTETKSRSIVAGPLQAEQQHHQARALLVEPGPV